MKELMYVKTGRRHDAVGNAVVEQALPSGMYELEYDSRSKTLTFIELTFKHDSILELPSPEYKQVVNEMEYFVSPTCKSAFDKFGFLYKRSFLLFGPPGTGKTIITSRVASLVMKQGGIVIMTDDPRLVKIAYNRLDSTNPKDLVCVVFEEMDEVVSEHEKDLLLLLDGEIQRENVVYLANTNFINKIPARIRRPGRFSSTIEVTYPNEEVRTFYFSQKMKLEGVELKEWVAKSNGMSIDELKELTLCVKCLNQDLDTVVGKIKTNRTINPVDEVDFSKSLSPLAAMIKDYERSTTWSVSSSLDDEESSDEEDEMEYSGN